MKHASLFSGIGEKYKHKCIICGNMFVSYNPNPIYCSRNCKAENQITKIDFEKIKKLYESGLTQCEIAEKLNTTQKIIYNTFKRNNYKCRVAKKRNQYGENNSSWVGNKAIYATLHKRVEVMCGKPFHCTICGKTNKNTKYEWANINGNYFDIQNGYARMCAKCHRLFDKSKFGVKRNVELSKK